MAISPAVLTETRPAIAQQTRKPGEIASPAVLARNDTILCLPSPSPDPTPFPLSLFPLLLELSRFSFKRTRVPDLSTLLQDGLAGRYTIERELGRGGMATVFLAHDLKHNRTVALKVLRSELAALIGPERFLREIALTAQLQHPHILPLFDSGESAGLLFYTMPYVEGESLRQRLAREQQLPVDEALLIASEVADALSYAHAHGVIHRDIKPENILLEAGHAVVADFGIAKAISEAGGANITSEGLAVGTPLYMSPEQATGTQQIDGRADVYSLGCVVYEMLAGAPPFTGRTGQSIAARHAVDPVPSLRTVRSTVTQPMEQAITKALAKVPADRFPSAREFGRALEAASPRTSPLASRWWRSASLALVVLLVVLGFVALREWRQVPDKRDGGRPLHLVDNKEPPRIAVLYFDDKTPDNSLRLFADGLTEELIHELNGVNAFRVISRNGVRPFRDRQVSFDSIVAALGVTTVIDGSVRRLGDSVQVEADLIDAASGTNVESISVNWLFTDVASLERVVALQIAAALRRRMGREVRLRDQTAGTVSIRARDLVLRASRSRDDAEALLTQPHPEELPAALTALRRADSLLTLAGRADSRWLRPLIDRGWVAHERARVLTGHERVSTLEGGLAFAEEAVRRAPESAEALELRGTLRWDLVEQQETAPSDSTRLKKAETDLRAALDRDSTLAGAWATLSYLLWLKGELTESVIAAQRALREDSYLADARQVYLQLFFSNLVLNDLTQAGEWCRRGRLSSPDDWRFVECQLTLLRHDLHARPDPDSAWALVRVLERLDPVEKATAAGRPYHPIYRRIVAATISARAGQRDTARAELARALRATAGDSGLRLDLAYDEAYLLLVLGERERARELLRALIAARPVLASPLARDPLFTELRPAPEGGKPAN